jgi:drug/metabolite transporter (DMT)-like permease
MPLPAADRGVQPRTDNRLAVAFGFAAALLWSTVATAFKLTLAHLDVFQLLFWAVLTACLCLGAAAAGTGRLPLLRRQTRADWLRAGLLGLLNPLAYYLILLEAYARLPGQIALAVNYSWPIALILLSVPLLRHRIGRIDAVAALICYGGVLVVSLPGGADAGARFDAAGLVLALGSTFVWAGYWIARAGQRDDPIVGLFMSFIVALPCAALLCGLASGLSPPPAAGLAGAVWVGLFEMGITFVVWLQALRLASSAAKVALLVYVSPFLSLIFIHHILGEPLRAATLVGLCLIIGALLLQQAGSARSRGAA